MTPVHRHRCRFVIASDIHSLLLARRSRQTHIHFVLNTSDAHSFGCSISLHKVGHLLYRLFNTLPPFFSVKLNFLLHFSTHGLKCLSTTQRQVSIKLAITNTNTMQMFYWQHYMYMYVVDMHKTYINGFIRLSTGVFLFSRIPTNLGGD